MDKTLNKAVDIIFAGDFNANLLNYKTDNHITNLANTLISLGQLPITTIPTRLTETTATLLDLFCVSNSGDNYKTGVIVTSIADHLPTYYIMEYNLPKPKLTETKNFRIYSDENKETFRKKATEIDWLPLLNDNNPESAFEFFDKKMGQCFEEAFPLKTLKVNKKTCPLKPWITKAILISRQTKEKLLRKN